MKKTVKLVSLKMVREKSKKYDFISLDNPKCVVKVVKDFIGEVNKEYIIVIALNSNSDINAMEICSIGTSTEGIMSTREIFKLALLSNSSRIILVHIHPSGNVEPSKEDINTTSKVIEASKIMEIEVLDHIIIGKDDYYSFAQHMIL